VASALQHFFDVFHVFSLINNILFVKKCRAPAQAGRRRHCFSRISGSRVNFSASFSVITNDQREPEVVDDGGMDIFVQLLKR
jgi:hypothetical protein